MQSQDNLPLKDKLNELRNVLSSPESLTSSSEGSKIIVFTVSPKEETKTIDEMNHALGNNTSFFNTAKFLTEVANDYGLDNLKNDYDFLGNLALDDFSHILLDKLKTKVIEYSKENELTIVHRIGILNGFLGIYPLIERVSGKLTNPVVIIYPGKRKDHRFTFLNGRHTTSMYRAIVIWIKRFFWRDWNAENWRIIKTEYWGRSTSCY